MRRLIPLAAALVLAAAPLWAQHAPDSSESGKDQPEQARKKAPQGVLGARHPQLSPDGERLAFSVFGDIWTQSLKGGRAVRLTLHEAYDIKPLWSPDGKQIAFTSNRDGSYDVYVMSAEGGAPRRLTFHSAADIASAWMPDGKAILFHSSRLGELEVWRCFLDGATPQRLTRDGGQEAVPSKDGATIIYQRGSYAPNVRRYQGSANWDLWEQDLQGGPPRQLTDFPGNDKLPQYDRQGRVLYLSEREGVFRPFRYDPLTREHTALADEKLGDLDWPALSFDGKTLAVVRDFRIFLLDYGATLGEARPVALDTKGDSKGYDLIERTITAGIEDPDLSPDGAAVVFSLGGDLWIMPAEGGEARQLTSGPAAEKWPRFSPDGAEIAFFSNHTGNQDLFVMPVKGGKARNLTNHEKDDFFHDWSPDGKWIVFCSDRSGNKDIWKIPADGGAAIRLTDADQADDDPTFTPDGKSIVFDSQRRGNADIFIMDADGKNQRPLTHAEANEQVPQVSPDGKWIVFETFDATAGGLWLSSLDNGGVRMQLSPDGNHASWAPDGKSIIYSAERQGEGKQIYRQEVPEQILRGRKVTFIAKTSMPRQKENAQVFQEAWMNLKNEFYDDKMHGVDWDAARKKYEPVCVSAETKEEFYWYLSLMIGELQASHMGIWGISSHRGGPQSGYLGLAFEPVELPLQEFMVVEEVVPGGPADLAWVRKGDHLFSIGGKNLGGKQNYYALLEGLAGREVVIEVGPNEDRAQARKVKVKLASAGQLAQAAYDSWEKRCRDRVAARGKQAISYVHLNAMDERNLAKFREAVTDAVKNKRLGLIIDVRNNGGGNIHQQLLDILSRKQFGRSKPRNGEGQLEPSVFWDRPTAVLTNQRSFSDAEIFPYAFQQIGRGKVIGEPTAGGVIGTRNIQLSDGSTFRVPLVGWHGLGEQNLENFGVKPDIAVPETPEDRRLQRDPQLDRAIDELRLEIASRQAAEKPAPKPESPKEPAPDAGSDR